MSATTTMCMAAAAMSLELLERGIHVVWTAGREVRLHQVPQLSQHR
jgi:hypothetical protein